jgi:serine/threonine protein kinase
MDPEGGEGEGGEGGPTRESDVYSFGVVVLEVRFAFLSSLPPSLSSPFFSILFSLLPFFALHPSKPTQKPQTNDTKQIYTHLPPFSHRRFSGGVVVDVVCGLRLPRPASVFTDGLWDLVRGCWAQDPQGRLLFVVPNLVQPGSNLNLDLLNLNL